MSITLEDPSPLKQIANTYYAHVKTDLLARVYADVLYHMAHVPSLLWLFFFY